MAQIYLSPFPFSSERLMKNWPAKKARSPGYSNFIIHAAKISGDAFYGTVRKKWIDVIIHGRACDFLVARKRPKVRENSENIFRSPYLNLNATAVEHFHLFIPFFPPSFFFKGF